MSLVPRIVSNWNFQEVQRNRHMPQPANFPIFSLAAQAITDAVRAIRVVLTIYWLPMAIYIIVLVIARVIWFEHVTTKFRLPVWIEVALWAPFGAVMATAAFRYFAGANPPDWRKGFRFGPTFWLSVLCLLVVSLVYRYAPAVEQESVLVAWRYIAGPNWIELTPDGHNTIAGIRLLAQVAGFAANALVGAVAMGATWLVATRDVLDFKRLKQLLLVFPLSLFAYLFIFEIIIYQVGLLIDWLLYWLSIPHPAPPPQLGNWRERVAPELLRQLYDIPSGFVVTLLWLTALATAFRYLDGHDPSEADQDDH